ncbi:putative bifunctional diguanylate cyclase/phosphodiesterase [Tardiphaga sp. 215_C5_N2_1]|uniref:putative bifunctional diguanylate cyclase/phosphodiesterase n=1 Tax=Tardiphaga sp. 215_C5_N2_1 TaxID=3240774 RepID=UPI003F898C95
MATINQLKRMFAALSAANEAILRARDPDEMLQMVCRGAVDGAKSIGTAIFFLEAKSSTLMFRAGASNFEHVFPLMRISVDERDPNGSGLAGIAFRTGKTQASNDVRNDPRSKPWRHLAEMTGTHSTVVVPLFRKGETVGVMFFLFDKRTGTLNRSMIELMERLAENVGYGLDAFVRIEEKRQADERLQFLATHDGLTGLPNRSMFESILKEAVQGPGLMRSAFALLLLDLDGFKSINDTLGHAAGDELLKDISRRLRTGIETEGVVARLGGDEFIMIIENVADRHEVARIASALLASVMRPVALMGQECRVTASIGIALFPVDGCDERTLTQNADAAMYLAKREGKNDVRFFSNEIEMASEERLALTTSLRRAVEHGEFVVQYQPMRELSTGAIVGVEALLRWMHPDLGLTMPDRFIHVGEEAGLTVPIGRWLLKTVCKQNMEWQSRGCPPLRMVVSLTPRQLRDHTLFRDVQAALSESCMPAHLLELDVPEKSVFQGGASIDLLQGLKTLGVHLAIDDFGMAYSAVSERKPFPVDTVRIGRSFGRGMEQDAGEDAVADAMVGLGKAMGFTVIPEMLRTSGQATAPMGYASNHAPVGRAISANDMESLLQHTLALSPPLQPSDHEENAHGAHRTTDQISTVKTTSSGD